ncbi:aspartate carbamoyltransferase catalytic subunit [Janibacter melonis]|uniref:aspartate carbamoyltransferase catalytic subunit n=1 Tax=Janibacter TaxID=53457 RepID=UPI002042EBD7|nr:aspartate carbamoyltransferase catalytic subunit [Janibacter melonis]MCM3556092.1 aspartate carbamoyltransferase catalytic subunit [Janibacter melonis]
MTRHLLSVADLDAAGVRELLDTAAEMHQVQRREVKKIPTLRGRTVINLFFEDSTRTRSSFEIAGKWMSADTINITGKGSSTSKGESLRDTTMTIASMGVDAIVMRHHASGAAHQVARWLDELGTGTSVINAGDGTHEHPTQALLDAYTVEQRLGSLEGRHVAIVGDVTHSRVFRSNLVSLRLLGARVTVVAPPTLMPSGARAWAERDGFALSHDLDAVLAGTHAPVPDVLMMLRVQHERMSGGYFPTPREYTVGYGLTRDRLATFTAASPEGVICHPGPMNRGLEIAADAADAASSLVLDQVSAGVAVRMSVLYHLLASGEGDVLRREGRASKGAAA